MDIYSLLEQINQKLDLLLNAHGLNQDKVHSEDSDEEYGRSLARQLGTIRSDEK